MRIRAALLTLLLAVLVVSGAASAAVSLPKSVPGMLQQTTQKDKPAVVEILTVVSGSAVFPAWTIENPVADSADLFGTWSDGSSQWTFGLDRTLEYSAGNGTSTGTYTADGTTLGISVNGQSSSYPYSVSTGSPPTLTISTSQGPASYQQTAAPSASDVRAAILAGFKVVADTSSTATTQTQDATYAVSGSGFIVSSDGYIVTNAHVVLSGEKDDDLIAAQVVSDLQSQVDKEIQGYYNLAQDVRDQISQRVQAELTTFVLQNGQLRNVDRQILVVNGVASPGTDLRANAWPASVKKVGEDYDAQMAKGSEGKDIAILKVEKTNLPTVRLGDSDTASVGDSTFIIGYPGLGAVETWFKPASALEPTVSQGVVSAKRTLPDGVETVQTDAAINHGNSGGPVYNDQGEVIGIATFGSDEVQNIKFAMPVNLAKQLLKELNVDTSAGPLDRVWIEGLDAFWHRDCDTAMTKMRATLGFYPGHPYANDYINECERAIATGEIAPKPATVTPATNLTPTAPSPASQSVGPAKKVPAPGAPILILGLAACALAFASRRRDA